MVLGVANLWRPRFSRNLCSDSVNSRRFIDALFVKPQLVPIHRTYVQTHIPFKSPKLRVCELRQTCFKKRTIRCYRG